MFFFLRFPVSLRDSCSLPPLWLYGPSAWAASWCRSALALHPRGLYVVTRLLLLQRAIKAGGDSRFDEVKHQTGTFTVFWMAQGLSADPFLLRVLTPLQPHGFF
jgi:hypothetical protein